MHPLSGTRVSIFSYCSGVGSAVDFQPKIDCRLGLGAYYVFGVFGGELGVFVECLLRCFDEFGGVFGVRGARAGRAGVVRGRAGEFAGAGRW